MATVPWVSERHNLTCWSLVYVRDAQTLSRQPSRRHSGQTPESPQSAHNGNSWVQTPFRDGSFLSTQILFFGHGQLEATCKDRNIDQPIKWQVHGHVYFSLSQHTSTIRWQMLVLKYGLRFKSHGSNIFSLDGLGSCYYEHTEFYSFHTKTSSPEKVWPKVDVTMAKWNWRGKPTWSLDATK